MRQSCARCHRTNKDVLINTPDEFEKHDPDISSLHKVYETYEDHMIKSSLYRYFYANNLNGIYANKDQFRDINSSLLYYFYYYLYLYLYFMRSKLCVYVCTWLCMREIAYR